jgi:hypothetical protein
MLCPARVDPNVTSWERRSLLSAPKNIPFRLSPSPPPALITHTATRHRVRQVGAIRLGERDSVIRSLIVHALLDYWDQHGLNWTPHQASLEAHVLKHAPFKPDLRTIRDVLGQLVTAGAIMRTRIGPKAIVYRLNRRFANPLSPGYSREITDLLVEPVPWVTRDGDFLRLGLPNDGYPHSFVVPTFPHFFAQHLWMRGWIHALNEGIITHYPDWQKLIVKAVRESPPKVLEAIVERESVDTFRQASELIQTTRLWPRLRMLAARRDKFKRFSEQGRWMNDWPEEALAIIHALCGHTVVDQISSTRYGSPLTPRRALSERTVYRLLDLVVQANVVEKLGHLSHETRDACERSIRARGLGMSSQSTEGSIGRIVDGAFVAPPRFEPRVEELESVLRNDVPRPVLQTLTKYRLAWPRELYSPAW